jgi:hypothetical protein
MKKNNESRRLVSPTKDKRRRKRFEDALATCNKRYGKALKRLAE